EDNIAAAYISHLVQALMKCRGVATRLILRSATEEPDHVYHRLLRVRRERPCDRRTAKQRDETASMYLIECHPIPMSRDRTAEYRIYEGQSGGIWQGHEGAGPLPRSGSVIWLGACPPR